MEKGKVKWYNELKGFGFILSDSGQELFVHRNSLIIPFAGLQQDEEVTYDTRNGQRGQVAINVKSANL